MRIGYSPLVNFSANPPNVGTASSHSICGGFSVLSTHFFTVDIDVFQGSPLLVVLFHEARKSTVSLNNLAWVFVFSGNSLNNKSDSVI